MLLIAGGPCLVRYFLEKRAAACNAPEFTPPPRVRTCMPQAGAEVQMVVPADMAFGDKGICIDNGECLVKPGSEVRYDLQLKRVAPTP